MEETYKIYNGDCFKIMQQLIDNGVTVDAIICDPPYVINYADWDKEFNMPLAIKLCDQLLKENGNLILFQGWSNVTKTISLLDEKFKIQNWIIWDRIKGRGAKKILFQQEKIFFGIVKGITLHTQKFILISQRKTGGLGKKNGQENRALTNVWYDISPIVPWSSERNGHPTQKPLQLMERCITIWTNEGDTILDFTMGSGTTGEAALKLGRKFIGIEQDQKWFDIAKNRLVGDTTC